jgi:hypothetical protein
LLFRKKRVFINSLKKNKHLGLSFLIIIHFCKKDIKPLVARICKAPYLEIEPLVGRIFKCLVGILSPLIGRICKPLIGRLIPLNGRRFHPFVNEITNPLLGEKITK